MAETTKPESNATAGSQKSVGARDAEYYFKLVVFRVGDTLFSVPRHGFDVPGTIFETMFSLPASDKEDVEGSSDENPIFLPVDVTRFRGLLRIIYPLKKPTDEECLGALELSTMWMFDEIRSKAISALDKSGWVTKQNAKTLALIAKKHRIVSWLRIAYESLLRQNTLTTAELREHPEWDWETIARLCCVKLALSEQVVDRSFCSYCKRNLSGLVPICGCSKSYQSFIGREFQEEIREMERTKGRA